MAEGGFELGVVSEPYWIPRDHPNWFTDPTGEGVAISWRPTATPRPCSKLGAGHGFVAVEWGEWVVLGCYAPPSWKLPFFKIFLAGLGDSIRGCLPRPTLVAGDFNAWSTLWSSSQTNGKGGEMVNWAAAFGLCLLNTDSRSTCVRTRGESIVDLTWASPSAARRITGWWVGEDLDSGPDHRYIVIEASTTPTGQLGRRRRNTRRGWVLRKINEDILMAVILVESWPKPSGQAVDLEEEATRVVSMVEDACEASMPRSRWSPGKAMYWWTEKIAEFRRLFSAARRTFLRVRKRGDHARMTEALEGFRAARNALRAAIRKEKARA
ncbi:uncharacterized protein [Linepithema humile]|uniref:uncharacterized protein n=1 Tax=Linepithema humile TaxID=83485 RepID=UPI000623501A|nr:PREDICTED: uncharacterized protein LOC105678378 [Linepithema humile]